MTNPCLKVKKKTTNKQTKNKTKKNKQTSLDFLGCKTQFSQQRERDR